MRSRLIITMFSGATTPRASASRSSATDLPENSVPVADSAAWVACRPAFSACCCRARFWPPFFAPARCAALLREEVPLRELEDPERELVLRDEALLLRAEPPLLAEEPLREEALLLRAEPEPLREDALLLRDEPPLFAEDPLREEALLLREPELRLDEREPEPPRLPPELREPDPLREPPDDSAMPSPPSILGAWTIPLRTRP
jgi:hypothetical protein